MRVTAKSRARIGLVAVFILATGLLTACGGSDEDSDSNSPIKISTDGFVIGAQVWVAQDQGYFEDEDVSVDPEVFQTGADGVRALAGGQVDLAIALDFASMVSMSDGLRLLGTVASPAPGFYQFVVSADVDSAADLEGRKLGYLAGTQAEYVNEKFFEQEGADLSAVELVPMPGENEAVVALKTGRIAAAWLSRASAAQLAESKDVKVLNDDSSIASTQGIYLIGRTDWVADHTDDIEKVMKALESASTFIAEDLETASQIVATSVKGDVAVIEQVIPGQNYGLGFSRGNLERLESLQRFLLDSGQISASKPIVDYLALDAMEAALPEKVEAP